LELEHYPGMAEAEIGNASAARPSTRFALLGIAAIHRVGKIAPGEKHRAGHRRSPRTGTPPSTAPPS
jgi:molybdopterin synthase catalytic subunit